MNKNSFKRNKYTLSVLILLISLAVTDIILHKGMSRVLISESFTKKRIPQNFPLRDQPLTNVDKNWYKGINTVKQIEQLPIDAGGFELDVYFDTVKNHLQVYHDSMAYSTLSIEEILKVYKIRKLSASIWFDFKNLSSVNEKKSLRYISYLRQEYNLMGKVVVESTSPEFLQSFCDSGFFTSYYTPFFNPYLLTEKELIQTIDTIAFNIKKYPASALSGYYFQYVFLKKFFPNYPVLVWAARSSFSVVGKIFHCKLRNDQHVKIVLLSW